MKRGPLSGGAPPSLSFNFLARSPNNVQAWQGCAWDGQYWWVTAYFTDGEQQWTLMKYDASFTLLDFRDLGTAGDALHKQICGVYYDTSASKLYVCANNYPTTPARGWLFEINPTDLSVTTYYDMGAKWSESIWPWNGYWWEVNASGHEIRQFNSSFSLVATHTLPDTSPGSLYWQGIFTLNDRFYVNLHASAGGGMRAYEWNGSGFTAVATSLSRPSTNCTQGLHFDGHFIYWAERIGTFPPLEGHVVVSSAYTALKLYCRPVTTGNVDKLFKGFTIIGAGGTGPYTYSVQSGSLPAGLSLNTSTGAVTGTPTSAGTSSGIILRVTDSLGATADSDPFSIVISAALTPWQTIATQSTLKAGTLPVLGLDLTGLTAVQIHLVGITVTTDDSYIAIDFYSGGRVVDNYKWVATGVSSGSTTGQNVNAAAQRIALSETGTGRMVGNASTESFFATVMIDNPASSLDKKLGGQAAYIMPDGSCIRTRQGGILTGTAIDGFIVYGGSALTGGKVIVTALN